MPDRPDSPKRHADVRAEVLPDFVERVRSERLRADLSQERLAAAAGLDRTLITRIERGDGNVNLVTLVKLARALGTTPSKLLDDII